MRRYLRAAGIFAVITVLCACSGQSADPAARVAENWGVLDRYCTDCHNNAEFAGDRSFETVRPEDVAANPEAWEHVVRKLRGDLMPPPGETRPDPEQIDSFVASLEAYLDDTAAKRGPQPGRVPLHRLNRTEYGMAIEELLSLRIDARSYLPADIASDGFDNVADVLRVSPSHLDQFIGAARDISILAVGLPAPDPTRADYRSSQENRTVHVDGLPLGTRGGMVVEHNFPSDGEYQFNLAIASIPGSELRGYPYGWLEHDHRLVIVIDGVKVFEESIGGAEDSRALDQGQIQSVDQIRARFQNIRVPVKAGVRKVGAAFFARSYAEGAYPLQALTPGEGVPDVPRLYGMEVLGPYNPTGISADTESRLRIFSCYPESESEQLPCATEILTDLARRAYRRPVDSEDLAPVLPFYASGREAGGFETGGAPSDLEPGSSYPISDLELAWRLSFFLWSQGPDDALLALAESGQLQDTSTLEQQVRRMLADPRSESLVTNFAFQWLGVRRMDAVDPDPRLYPNFDEDLRRAFRTEMHLFLDSIFRQDRSVLELISGSHTFLNERLARHYGIQSVRGDQFRRLELEDSRRWGLFGKGSVLMVTSYPDRTSPVLRGAWIMDQIFATPPTPPPPGVETDLAVVQGDIPRSVRERLALHRSEPSCNQCHGVIDPLGQALENYNAIGEWRVKERDSGVAIDSSGVLAGGGEIDGPDELRAALLNESGLFVQALTEKLMTYALGRGLDYYDMPTVRAIVADSARDQYSFSSIVVGIAKSPAFRMRAVPEPASDDVQAAAAIAERRPSLAATGR
jgi:hypothetical protein